MGYTIALAGKGGTGKTTIAALLVDYLRKMQKGSILAIDADPNSTLNEALGIELEETVVGIVDKVAAIDGGLPAGMTKDRFIEYEVQNSLSEGKGFDLLAMGRPEGPGCYCYANTVLRSLIEKLSRAYDFVVIDNEAGMEHLSRRIARKIDDLLIVSDFSRIGIRSAKRISDLAKDMGLEVGSEYLIVNMARPVRHCSANSSENGVSNGARGDLCHLENEIEKSGLKLAGVIPFDKGIEELSLAGKPIICHPEAQRAEGSLNRFFASLRMTIK